MSIVYRELELEILNRPDFSLEHLLQSFAMTDLIEQHQLLTHEYNILIATMSQEEIILDSQSILPSLLLARKLAITLTLLNEKYLAAEAIRFREDEIILRAKLHEEYQYNLMNPWLTTKPSFKNNPVGKTIRQEHPFINWVRLFLVRVKRLLTSLRPLLENIKSYKAVLDPIDKISNPFFAQLSWAFFAPRLLVNIQYLFQRCVPGLGMSPEEKTLPLSLRFKNVMDSRGLEIANDAVWLASGTLNCFLLLGSMLPVAIYLTAALYWYDVLLSCIRIHTELKQLNQLHKEYAQEDRSQVFKKQLSRQINYNDRRLLIGLSANVGLAVAIIFTLPCFVVMSPMFPFTAAIMLLTITLANYLLNKLNESSKLQTHSGALANHGIFKTCPPIQHIINEQPPQNLATNP